MYGLADSAVRTFPWVFLSRAELYWNGAQAREQTILSKVDSLSSTFSFLLVNVVLYLAMAFPLYRWISPAVAICTLFGLLIMAYAVVACFTPAYRLLVLVAVVALVIVTNNDSYKLTFEGLGCYYPDPDGQPVDLRRYDKETFGDGGRLETDRSPGSQGPGAKPMERMAPPAAPPGPSPDRPAEAPGDPAAAALLLDDDRVLEAWLAETSEPGKVSPKLVVVAISGGALRSAMWAGVVLNVLGTDVKSFPRHVRIITGASGGMLGAAYYTVALTRDPPVGDITTGESAIPTDSLEEVARRLALGDSLSVIDPRTQGTDRGRVLEQTWKALDITFQSLRDAEAVRPDPLDDLLADAGGGRPPAPDQQPRPESDDRDLWAD